MEWDVKVNGIVENVKENFSDQRKLAEILLAQTEGSLVAEGMVIVVEEKSLMATQS